MTVWIPQLVDNRVDEADSGLIIQLNGDGFEQLNTLLFTLLRFTVHAWALMHSLSDEQYHCIDDRGGRHHSAMDALFARHHF